MNWRPCVCLIFFGYVNKVQSALSSSKSQAYRIIKKLREKELINNNGFLVNVPYLKNLVFLLRKNLNLVSLLREYNLAILLQMLSPITVKKLVTLLVVMNKQCIN
ncbi:MAG: hypothetical protein BWY55_00175 [archaeon ADurb.Bin336]|nr:MAG: hypothetical protein BWY55_00175 [archaeon ADurb.Bin336]